MGITKTLGLAVSFADKLMDRIPTYDQRKKAKYHKIKRNYNNEINKDYDLRDDNLVVVYRDELCDFLESFSTEISK